MQPMSQPCTLNRTLNALQITRKFMSEVSFNLDAWIAQTGFDDPHYDRERDCVLVAGVESSPRAELFLELVTRAWHTETCLTRRLLRH